MDEMRLQEIEKMLKTSHFNARMNALNEVRLKFRTMLIIITIIVVEVKRC